MHLYKVLGIHSISKLPYNFCLLFCFLLKSENSLIYCSMLSLNLIYYFILIDPLYNFENKYWNCWKNILKM